MSSYNDEFSGSDSDPHFEEDMEALRRACTLTGATDSIDDDRQPSTVAACDSESGDDDATFESEDEDMELVRRIQERFSVVTTDFDVEQQPLCEIRPTEGVSVENDDDEDDFETLRAIKRRFSQYNDSVNNSTESSLNRLEQVGANNTDLEMDSNLVLKRINNDGQGFPDCVDGRGTTQDLDLSSNFDRETIVSNISESGGEVVPVTNSGFPGSALAFVDAIKKNRSCQKFIRSKLIQIEARMEENRKLRERVKILKDFQVACRKRTGRALSQKRDPRIQLISIPKQRANTKISEKKTHAIYHGPAENCHVAYYKDAMSKYPFSMSREPWSNEEKENLVKGIRQQFQEMLLQNVFSAGNADSDDLDSIIAKIKDREITSEEIKSFLPKVNWEQLSSMYVPGRSGAECEGRWLNCEDPLINQDKWTKEEDKNILQIVQDQGIRNWFVIARRLGTNRTAFQCLSRFQRSLNASIIKREWSNSEDDELSSAVAEFGESNWQLVASTLDGRTGTQCSNRWKKSLNPLREKVGKWSPDEDKRLKIAVMLFGARNWNKIAGFVPGRTQVQCRERWVNCLDPCLNMGEWTEEEDMKLKAAIDECGYKWSKVAKLVPPRTDSQCRRRWKVLLPDQVPVLQAFRKMQKSALISNFVDREEERPTLEPGDFIPPRLIEAPTEPKEADPRAYNKKKRSKKVQNGGGSSYGSKTVQNRGGSSYGSIPKIRSRRARKVTHTEKVLRLTDGHEVEEDGDHTDLPESGLQDVKVSSVNEIEAAVDDGPVLAKKNGVKKPYSPSSPLYPLMLETGEIAVTMVEYGASTDEGCNGLGTTERTCEDPEAHGDDSLVLREDESPRCATPDILDSLQPKASGRARGKRSKKQVNKLHRPVNDKGSAGDDDGDMTLAYFLVKPRQRSVKPNAAGKASGSQESSLPPKSVSSGKKSSTVRKRTLGQTYETQEDDDLTLASFRNKLKKRRLQQGKDC